MITPHGHHSQESPPAWRADFIISAAARNQFPPEERPEVALLGRSNSGKSSLMNRWLGRKGLARVGSTPGRTRLINFFEVAWTKETLPFTLADLPGYGFAAAPKNMVAGWRKLVSDYLESGRPIAMALLLMDIRRNIQDEERDLLKWLEQLKIPAWLILTKADKLTQRDRSAQVNLLNKQDAEWPTFGLPPLPFSATTGAGREELIKTLVTDGLIFNKSGRENFKHPQ